MSHFDKAIIPVLQHEGGYVNHPADPGGETKFGICRRQYPHLDIKHLTVDDAKDIYRSDYWNHWYDQINDFRIASKVFDISVNCGPRTSAKMLQWAADVDVDGVIGPNTIRAVNASPTDDILDSLVKSQKSHYESLIVRNPHLESFRKGWMKRAEWLPEGEGEA